MGVAFDFSDRTVIVTGGAQGLGAEFVRTFHSAGGRVVVVDLSTEAVAQVWGEDDRILPVACDVSNSGECARLVQAVLQWGGAVDVLINNAGIVRDRVVWKLSDSDWQEVIGVHLTGTFNMTRAVVVPMRERGYGRIVNVTSYTGLHGNFGQANYAAAKAGIVGFSKAVAKEVARFGITVNVVSPNAETPMVSGISPEKKAELTSLIPLGRFGTPGEIGPGVAFLASDSAGYITGAVVPIDGGLSM